MGMRIPTLKLKILLKLLDVLREPKDSACTELEPPQTIISQGF